MAQVPREAVEFTRMVVRAFHTPEYIVITDAVLRSNNYCAHHDLARRLRIQPKELRQILIRMVHARLMRNEKRQQKRINYKDERRPTRTVNTEFWYVPLAEVVDAFSYRVHRIVVDVEAKRSNELAARKHTCERCGTEYQLLDILSNMTENDQFLCDRMGVRPDRRPLPCGGIIREKDNRAQLKETERMLQKLEEELKPLRSRADLCSRMHIPAHPLDGADEETWGEIVPETVGIYGEAVDDEGLNKELSARLNDNVGNGDAMLGIGPAAAAEDGRKDDGVIPEKPSWFKDSNRDADEMEEDWENEKGAGQNVLNSKAGTAASFFAAEDEKLYYERYLRDIGGAAAGAASGSATPEAEAGEGVEDVEKGEGFQGGEKAIEEKEEAGMGAVEAAPVEEDEEDVLISVGGKQVKLSEVSEEMTELMTPEEWKAYHALAQSGGGGDEFDDDEEFE